MLPSQREELTQSLIDLSNSERKPSADKLFEMVYQPLKQIAQSYINQERKDLTIEDTGFVHEAYFKMVDQKRVDWKGKTHFLAIGAQAMRRILVDYARAKGRVKRGSGIKPVEINDRMDIRLEDDADVLFVDEALKRLAKLSERQAHIVEMRFFGGMNVQEVSEVLGVSKRTVENDWTMAKAWLRKELDKDRR